MKKVFTILFAVFFVFAINAQTLPNGGFEQWTDSHHATGWNSSFSQTISYMGFDIPINYVAALQSGDAHTGSYSMKLQAQNLVSILSVPLPGVAHLGQFNTTSMADLDPANLDISNLDITDYLVGGIPFNQIPQKVTAYIKYAPDADTLRFIAVCTRRNGNQSQVVAKGEYTTSQAVSEWTKVELPMEIQIAGVVPDTLNIIFLTNNGMSSSLTTELYLDDAQIVMNGDDDRIFDVTSGPIFNIFPNPSSDYILLQPACTLPYQAQLFDTNGQLVWSENNLQNDVRISVSGYAKGVYFLKIKQGEQTRSEKVIVK